MTQTEQQNRRWLLALSVIVFLLLACGNGGPSGGGNPGGNGSDGPPPGVEVETARVLRVIDGDTIEVQLNGQAERVRYILVNTPETNHPTKGREPFGEEAKAANRELVANQTVYLEKDVSERDQYGRLLRYVYVGELMINEELLRQGLAQVSTFPPDVKYVDRFLDVQRAAQESGAGMWASGDFTPVPPPAADSPVVIAGVNVVAEYADLRNTTRQTQRLAGWKLVSERGGQTCELDGVLRPNTVLRVWAQAADANQGGFNCGFSQGVWSNSDPDPAVLYDPFGREMSRFE